jgi:hypothetical protein
VGGVTYLASIDKNDHTDKIFMNPSTGSGTYSFWVIRHVSMDMFPMLETRFMVTWLNNLEDLIAYTHHESIKFYISFCLLFVDCNISVSES